MQKPIVVIGAGGHAKVVISVARSVDREVVAVLDSNQERWGEAVAGVLVAGGPEMADNWGDAEFVVAIGENSVRQRMDTETGLPWATLVHATGWVEPSAVLGAGSVVMAGAIVQADTIVGRHVILNTGSTVDHDCRIGDYVHVAPGSHLSGAVTVGSGALLGVGSAVRPGVAIGDWTVLGAGSAAVTDLESNGLYGGVPARPLKPRQMS